MRLSYRATFARNCAFSLSTCRGVRIISISLPSSICHRPSSTPAIMTMIVKIIVNPVLDGSHHHERNQFGHQIVAWLSPHSSPGAALDMPRSACWFWSSIISCEVKCTVARYIARAKNPDGLKGPFQPSGLGSL